jgi:hypothetical protein
MKHAAITAAAMALLGAAITFGASKAYRCIDTAEFYYPPSLAYAWIGAALVFYGGATFNASRRWAVAALALGVVLLALSVGGPPFKGCRWFE